MDQNVIKPVFVIKTTVITRLDAKVTGASILVSLVNLEMPNEDVYDFCLFFFIEDNTLMLST